MHVNKDGLNETIMTSSITASTSVHFVVILSFRKSPLTFPNKINSSMTKKKKKKKISKDCRAVATKPNHFVRNREREILRMKMTGSGKR